MRNAAACFGGVAAAMLMMAACLPFGDDDGRGPAEDRVLPIISTFTPTVPGSTPVSNPSVANRSTEQPRSTATPQTSGMPGPTTAPLSLPKALLSDGVGSVESTEGSYAWVYLDTDPPTYASFNVPLVPFTESTLTTDGANLTIAINGVSEATTGIRIEVYEFEPNVAIPVDQTGQPAATRMFSTKEPPVAESSIGTVDESFSTDIAPGHYLIVARAEWPEYVHQVPNAPAQTFPIYITYVFNVEIE